MEGMGNKIKSVDQPTSVTVVVLQNLQMGGKKLLNKT